MATSKEPRSVTRLARSLEGGDAAEQERAAAQLWHRYGAALERRAKRNLAPAVRQREDEQDIAQSAYAAFCQGQREGKYQIDDRDKLWKLLTKIAENKAKAAAVQHRRGKRDHRREHQETGEDGPTAAQTVTGREPTPSRVLMRTESEEAVEQMLAPLEEPLRQIVRWRLRGYTNEQIASDAMLGCTVRTVERKLERIREILGRIAGEQTS